MSYQIISNEQLSENVFRMEVEAPLESNPGIHRHYDGPIDLVWPTFYVSPMLGDRPAGLIRELIGACVVDVVTTTSKVLEDNKLDSPLAVQQYDGNVVGYSPEMGRMVRQLKDYLYENMYRHYRLVRMQVKAERFVAALFEAYVAEPGMLPMKTQQQLENLPVERVVCDYIAGMTDRYALEEWEKLFDPYRNA